MKWVRRIFMFLLILAIAGCGVLAFLNFKDWSDAKEELDEVKAEKFEGEDSVAGFTTEENQKSVAFILCIAPDNTAYAWGSSYAVGADVDGKVQYLVTNGHVVQPHKDMGYSINVVFEDEEMVTPEVVFYEFDEQLDMAILKLPEPVSMRKPVVIRDSDTVTAGEKCVAIGYPDKAAEVDSNFSGDISSQSVNSGVISNTNVVPAGSSYTTFQHDSFISHGNSGGPLFDKDGFLIGMNTLGREDTDSVNYAIVSNSITDVLDEYDIDYVNSEDYLDDIEGELSAAKKKFDKKHDAEVADAEEVVTEARNKMLVFVIAAAVCAIALLILFIVGNKKVVMVGEQDDGKKSYLICTKGIFAGQTFEIADNTMTIGRDKNSCTFVFPEETPGISSNHCSVYFDVRTKTFVLTDNGSTYGTYLSNGRKLTKGVPEKLAPGSTFALADKANEFMVDRK
ncbi:MAG: trypsin-like peptidase domain-containing protein [Clostridiales bacterium]|nr:trypsin-like peptidase domain-containing protein [Clostridiales bacterium]